MEIKKIMTARRHVTEVCYDLVYEWEDVLKEQMQIDFSTFSFEVNNSLFYRAANRIFDINILRDMSLKFDMVPWGSSNPYNSRKIIPCIIDFFQPDERLQWFEKGYSRSPIVLISSREVYDYLIDRNCRLRIAHWPLSLSDKYRITCGTKYDKLYDLSLLGGHHNPVLTEYLKQYVEEHPAFEYVFTKKEGNHFCLYKSTGAFLGYNDTRSQYMDIMRKSRCCLYSTPGTDNTKAGNYGFSQVTPRLFEMLASGCHVIARYVNNSDTDYFNLPKIVEHCDDYERFRFLLDKARNEEVDMGKYAVFLENHYTSQRVSLLNEILNKL